MLSSEISHAEVLKKFFNHKANSPALGQSSSTTLTTLAENIEKVLERRFYTTKNSTRVYLHDNEYFSHNSIDFNFFLLFCNRMLQLQGY